MSQLQNEEEKVTDGLETEPQKLQPRIKEILPISVSWERNFYNYTRR